MWKYPLSRSGTGGAEICVEVENEDITMKEGMMAAISQIRIRERFREYIKEKRRCHLRN